jgi:uncharacterized membrane protein YkoI
MKKSLLTIFTVVFALMACAQDAKPPKEVQDAFSEKYSSVQKVDWDQEEGEWEAEFKWEGTEMTVCFDNAGKWLETETEVKKKDVPSAIMEAINQKYEGWKIEEIEMIEKPDFKGYELALEKGETETEILISEAGGITVKKVSAEEGEED